MSIHRVLVPAQLGLLLALGSWGCGVLDAPNAQGTSVSAPVAMDAVFIIPRDELTQIPDQSVVVKNEDLESYPATAAIVQQFGWHRAPQLRKEFTGKYAFVLAEVPGTAQGGDNDQANLDIENTNPPSGSGGALLTGVLDEEPVDYFTAPKEFDPKAARCTDPTAPGCSSAPKVSSPEDYSGWRCMAYNIVVPMEIAYALLMVSRRVVSKKWRATSVVGELVGRARLGQKGVTKVIKTNASSGSTTVTTEVSGAVTRGWIKQAVAGATGAALFAADSAHCASFAGAHFESEGVPLLGSSLGWLERASEVVANFWKYKEDGKPGLPRGEDLWRKWEE